MTQTPDYFHELVGWRKFAVRDHGRILVSANHPIPWLTADAGEAVCVAEPCGQYFNHVTSRFVEQPTPHAIDEPCPALACSCGFYCYKTRESAAQHQQGQLLAKVAVWGRIAEHAHGYRSARMRIQEIFVPMDYPAVDALAMRYHVPITRESELTQWISENPNGSSSQSPWQNLNGPYPSLYYPSTMPNMRPFSFPPFQAPPLPIGSTVVVKLGTPYTMPSYMQSYLDPPKFDPSTAAPPVEDPQAPPPAPQISTGIRDVVRHIRRALRSR